ncbi:hypothetical protein [Collimonas sp. OK412]|jgi:hypothetical protein|uniref:hypothetical protein n=1 Tax=Collimonas sp. (strain OK412) TaxID=1801619 RepID=UPI0008E3188A|nr:hypothetical protein [Collimonas sp. OK412]SFC98118.1 hypothetical protein SAMN04515619_11836 [Collimonas sp. OK412]
MDKQIKEILAFIGRSPKGASFYQLVRGFGFPDAPYDLQAVLHSFVEEHLAELQQPEAGVNVQYVITQKGIETIGITS